MENKEVSKSSFTQTVRNPQTSELIDDESKIVEINKDSIPASITDNNIDHSKE